MILYGKDLVHGLIQLIMSLSLLDGILFLNQRMLWYYMQKLADERQIFEQARFQVPLEVRFQRGMVVALWFGCLMNRSYRRPEVPSPLQQIEGKVLPVSLS